MTAAEAICIAHDEFMHNPCGTVQSYLQAIQRMGFDPRHFPTPQLMHDIAFARLPNPGALQPPPARGPGDTQEAATESEPEYCSPTPSPPPAPAANALAAPPDPPLSPPRIYRDPPPSPLPLRYTAASPVPAAAKPPRARALRFVPTAP